MHVMIDLETLGLTAEAMILQIGAVRFEPFYGGDIQRDHALNLHLSLYQPRSVDPGTLGFWVTAPDEVRLPLFRRCLSEGLTLVDALRQLASWYTAVPVEAVWSHGAAFDIPILDHAYHQCGEPAPWDHRDVRDTRTLYEFAVLAERDLERIDLDLPRHDALADACHQARLVQDALRAR